MIKVIHVLDNMHVGGSEMLMLNVCRYAKENGLEIILIMTGKGDLKNEFMKTGVKVYDFQRKSPFDINVIKKIRKVITEENPDAVHAHQAVEGVHAYFAALNKNVKLILSHHGYIPSAKENFALKFLLPKVYKNLFVSHGYKKRFESIFKPVSNSYILHNGVNVNNYFIEKEKEFGIDRGIKLQMGMVGNFVAAKDHMTICKSLKTLRDKNIDFKFTFVGNPDKDKPGLLNECKNFCSQNSLNDNVIFLSDVSDIKKIISAFDIFVFSSKEDTFGISVLEAMLAGVPVICSDIEPMMEVTSSGMYGLLFKTGDAEDLSGKIIQLSHDATLRKKLSADAKIWALENFNMNRHIENLKSVYTS